jgi:hypothetical protein
MLSQLSCTCSNSSATIVHPEVSSESDSELEDVRFMTSESSIGMTRGNMGLRGHERKSRS